MKYTNLFTEIKFFLTCIKKNYVNGDFDDREINQFKSSPPLKLKGIIKLSGQTKTSRNIFLTFY